MTTDITVIGIGDDLHRDDGFGPTVVRALLRETLPSNVQVHDYGTRSTHLAFDLVDVRGLVVFVDAAHLGDAAGTVTLLEPDLSVPEGVAYDLGGHGIDLRGVAAQATALGAQLHDVLLIGCEPADVTDGIGLTPSVAAAVPVAISMLQRLIQGHPVPGRNGGAAASTPSRPPAPTSPTDLRGDTDAA